MTAQSERSTLVPYLAVHDGRAAIEWYEAVFDAAVVPGDVHEMPDGRIGHATLIIGGAELYLADEYPEVGAVSPTTAGASTVAVVVRVGDVDDVFARAVAQGADPQRPPADQMGFRSCWFLDPFGHRWSAMSDSPADQVPTSDEEE